MTNWGYKAVRKVLQTFGGAELAQQQSGRITGEPGNPEVATLARRAGAESCVLLKNNNHTLPLDLSAPVALFGRVQKNYFYGGNGSGGDVSAPYSINLVQGLVNAGVQLDSTVLAAYESWCTASVNDPDPGFWGHWPRYYAEMPKILGMTNADMIPALVSGLIRRWAHDDKGSPCYAYCFDRDLPGDNYGAWHTADLLYAFGTLQNNWRPFTDTDREISRQMVAAFANFVK